MAIAYVRENYVLGGTNATPFTATLTTAPTVGNFIVVFTINTTPNVMTAITDNTGANTWTILNTQSGGVGVSIAGAPVTSSPSTITATYTNNTSNQRAFAVEEFSGVASVSFADAAAEGSATGTNAGAAVTGGAGTAVANEAAVLVVGFNAAGNTLAGATSPSTWSNFTSGGNGTTGIASSSSVMYLQYLLAIASGTTVSPSVGLGLGAHAFGMATVLLKPSTGGGPQTVNPSALVSAGSFGSVKANMRFSVGSLASPGAFGTPTMHAVITKAMTGLGSAVILGGPSVTPGVVTKAMTGLGSAALFGAPTMLPGGVTKSMVALASGGSFGGPTVHGVISVSLSGLGSAVLLGAPTAVPGAISKGMTGLASATLLGGPTLLPGPASRSMTGLASAVSFGSPTENQRFSVPSLASAGAFGSITPVPGPTTVFIGGLASAGAFGNENVSGGTPPTFGPSTQGRHFHR